MKIYQEKKRRPFLAPILVVVSILATMVYGHRYHQEKLTQAETEGFVGGCVNVAVMSKAMMTGQRVYPQEVNHMADKCFMMYKQIKGQEKK